MATVSLADVVAALGGDLRGDGGTLISKLGPLEAADALTLSFLANPRYEVQLAQSQAACVIVAPALAEQALARGSAIVTPDPYLYFARLTQWWAHRVRPTPPPTVHPTASIDPTAVIGTQVDIGPFAVIEAGACLGDGVSIGAHSVIEHGARIGAGSRLAARVVIGFDCQLGARCIVHSGVVIGADGFGFAPEQGRWVKIEQLGAVRIGDDVEIGANTCIDRGAMADTTIGDGVKIDNLVQIGHNVRIGEHTAIAGCVGIAGSAKIGAHCTLGGAAMIAGHLEIADHVFVTAATLISRSILEPGQYTGYFPFDDNATWEKNAANLRQLHKLRERVRALEKKV